MWYKNCRNYDQYCLIFSTPINLQNCQIGKKRFKMHIIKISKYQNVWMNVGSWFSSSAHWALFSCSVLFHAIFSPFQTQFELVGMNDYWCWQSWQRRWDLLHGHLYPLILVDHWSLAQASDHVPLLLLPAVPTLLGPLEAHKQADGSYDVGHHCLCR